MVRGSAGIYGSEPAAPQFFHEDMARLYPLRTRFQRDVGRDRELLRDLLAPPPEVTCTMLRYQPAIGPSLDTQVTRYLSHAACCRPTSASTRACSSSTRSDGLEALVAAVKNPVRGAVNVAGRGTIGLTRMVRMARQAQRAARRPAVRRRGHRPAAPARRSTALATTSSASCATAAAWTSPAGERGRLRAALHDRRGGRRVPARQPRRAGARRGHGPDESAVA